MFSFTLVIAIITEWAAVHYALIPVRIPSTRKHHRGPELDLEAEPRP